MREAVRNHHANEQSKASFEQVARQQTSEFNSILLAPQPLNSVPQHSSARGMRQSNILQTQRYHGNAYVSRMLAAGKIQRCGANCECDDCKAQSTQQPTIAAPTPIALPTESTAVARSHEGDDVQRTLDGRVQRETRTLPPEMRTFWQRWGAQIQLAKRMFTEQRYGCWCGPGNVCEDVQDDIDAACKRHDQDYGRVGVTSSSPPPAGQASMWSIEGFKRTMGADARLVAGVQATNFDLHFYGPSAALYKAGVTIIFGARAAIGAALTVAGWAASIPPEYLLMDLTEMDPAMFAANETEAPEGSPETAAA